MTQSLSERIARLSPEKRALLERRLKEQGTAASHGAPPSFAQHRLWFIEQLEPGSSTYTQAIAGHLRGALNVGALERGVDEIVRRHEVLRTTFRVVDGEPRQVVAPAVHVPLAVIDLTAVPELERHARARRIAKEEGRRPFDLAQGPLVRTTLLRLGPVEHVLILTWHHIVSDGWSRALMLRELSALYDAFANGRPSPLLELPIQYSDYARWQREWLRVGRAAKELAYWKWQLLNLPPLEVPTDRPRPAKQTFQGARTSVVLQKELARSIQALSRRERVTPFMTLLAAFQVLLARYTGRDDIAVGCPIAGRIRTEFEALIGCFINTLVLRTNLSGNPTFSELLARVRRTALEAYSNQSVPFEKLVEELRPERTLSHHPLFQVLFQLRNTPPSNLELPGLDVTRLEVDTTTAKFELSLAIDEQPEGLCCQWEYNTGLFDSGTVAHMQEQYAALLEQVTASSNEPVQSYSLVTARARAFLPDPRIPLPQPRFSPIVDTIAACIAEKPQRRAIRQGERFWTYGELGTSVDRLARGLVARGLRSGDRLAITGPRSFGFIVGMIATLSCGGVLIPIDSSLPDRRKRSLLREGGAQYLLRIGDRPDDDDLAQALGARALIRVVEHTGQIVDGAPNDEALRSFARPAVAPDDPAYIFFTSGTTGTPKGVLGAHKGLSHFLAWQRERFTIGPSDCCAQLCSVSFDPVLREVLLPLSCGATLCLPPKTLGPDEVLPWLATQEMTVLNTVPSLAQFWLDQAPSDASLPSLRWLFLAGEPLMGTLVRRWRRLLPSTSGIVNLYGPTETTMVKCFHVVPLEVPPGMQPVGSALPETQALVLTANNQLCGVNEPGEIVIRTPFRTRGYINAAEENVQRFTPNPFRDDGTDLLYHTGDVGRYRPDGSLMVLGRIDHQVKIHGVRIEPDEVSAVLAQHPHVRACTVLGRRDDGQPVSLVAYVVAMQDEVSSAALRAFLAERLPAAMVPAAFVFVERLPLTPNGKVDRQALPPPSAVSSDKSTYVAARTHLEELLTAIWATVLQRETVGVKSDFFELGGHSLLAAQVIARLRETFHVDLPVRALFEAPTIAELAERVERIRDGNASEGT